MIDIEESQELIEKFIKLRTKYQETKSTFDKIAFQKQENICVEKFMYLVTMKTGRYKNFANYEDLNQDGLVALLSAMKNYKPKKGLFFFWAHRYIGTRISRRANLHTAIRYPLKIAKELAPRKDNNMPVMIEEVNCPDKEAEAAQSHKAIRDVMEKLTDAQREVINLAFGFDGGKPLSVNKICNQLDISRATCKRTIKCAMSIMKENIKI